MSQDWFASQSTDIRPLGELIRARRMELGFTQEQLAEMISTEVEMVRQSDISNLERGRIKLPRRERLERIAIALQLTLGELLARSGWAEADRYLVAALLGIPPFAASETDLDGRAVEEHPETGQWWKTEPQAARIVSVKLHPGHIDSVLSHYRNAALWMATAEEGFRGFVLLTDQETNEIISVGFWNTDYAMRNSMASVYLPLQSLQFQHLLTEPATIDHFGIEARVRYSDERGEGRLSQLDHGAFSPVHRDQVINQFHHLTEEAPDQDKQLERSVLLFNRGTGRAVAMAIWREASGQPPQQQPQESSSPYFPQLITPASSHHYRVELEV